MIDRKMIPTLGAEISRLGYGGMRFPKNGDDVDFDAAVELLHKAYEMGINYFDTANMYTDSEEKIPRWSIIRANPRKFLARLLKTTTAVPSTLPTR